MGLNISNYQLVPKAPALRKVFVIECEAMIGDADDYKKVILGPFKLKENDDILEEAVKVCEKAQELYPNGKGGWDDYDSIEGFNIWFNNGDTVEGLDDDDYRFELSGEWPSGEHYGVASFESYEVFYYGQAGEKYSVDVEIED